MFASLFDQINLRSTANAAILLLLVLGSYLFLSPGSLNLDLPGWTANWSGPWVRGGLASLLLIQAFYLNEYLNRLRLFTGHNHSAVILALWSSGVLLWGDAGVWVIKSYFLIWTLQLLMRFIHAKELRYTLFDLGLFLGALSFWEPSFLWLLPLSWILALSLGQLQPRSFASSLLGTVAVVFFISAVSGQVNLDLWANWTEQLKALRPQLLEGQALLKAPTLLWLAYLACSLFLLPSVLSKTNIEQRQSIQIWVILALFALLGWAFLSDKYFWQSLGILAGAPLLAIELRQIGNRWLRDGIYLLLLLLYLAAISWSRGLLFS